MIKIDNTEVVGFAPALRGMRNPHNSWQKSDSHYDNGRFVIGNTDLELARRLIRSGSDHRKFMRMIVAYCDVTAPLYWLKEADTYKVGTVCNSCSTMHSIAAKEFTLGDFSCEHLTDELDFERTFKTYFEEVVNGLNEARTMYLETKDKFYWRQMIQLLPTSYNQRRTYMFSYEVLRNIYFARKAHKLDEWHEFCRWIEALPYGKELICVE